MTTDGYFTLHNPQHTDNLCHYNLTAKTVHEFVFLSGTHQAVEHFAQLWQQNVPAHWRNHRRFDGYNRLFFDFTHTDHVSVAYLYKSMRELNAQHPHQPPTRQAFLLSMNPALIAQLKTLMRTLYDTSLVQHAFFLEDERTSAMDWLLSR